MEKSPFFLIISNFKCLADEKAAWNCNVCKFKVDVNSVTKLLRNIQNEIEEFEYRESDDPIASREILIKKFRSVLHPNHALLLNLKSSLSQLYGIAYGYHLEDLPDILLERKIQLCELIGTVSNAIKPGLSRQRGKL